MKQTVLIDRDKNGIPYAHEHRGKGYIPGLLVVFYDKDGKHKKPLNNEERGSVYTRRNVLVPIAEKDVVVRIFQNSEKNFHVELFQITQIRHHEAEYEIIKLSDMNKRGLPVEIFKEIIEERVRQLDFIMRR